jgi:hypothetical protein
MDLGKAYFIYIYQADSPFRIVKSCIQCHGVLMDRLATVSFCLLSSNFQKFTVNESLLFSVNVKMFNFPKNLYLIAGNYLAYKKTAIMFLLV